MDIVGKFQAAENLRQQGRLAEAETLYRQVLEIDPRHFPALDILGVICVNSGRFDAAVDFIGRAAEIQPRSGRLHAYLGFALRRLGRPAEAVAAIDRAAELGHSDAQALNTRGVAFLDLKRYEDAAADFEATLALAPNMTMAAVNRGIALSNLEHHEAALESFDRATTLAPEMSDAWFRRGGSLKFLKRWEDALQSFDRALALNAGHVQARHHRSFVLVELARYEEALADAEAVLESRPDWSEALIIRSQILARLGRHEDAVEAFTRIVAVEPDNMDAYRSRGLALLALGRFAAGWDDYEKRWGVQHFLETSAPLFTADLLARIDPGLRREDLKGRNALVVAEQGVGDVIMFASILPDLMAEAAQVSLLVEGRLHRLFSSSFPELVVLRPSTAARAAGDILVPLGSLARLYRNDLDDFPGTPYLSAAPEVRARWSERLGPRRGLRIGLSWRGGTAMTRLAERSMALADLRPVLDLPGREFVSLQYGDVADEIALENEGRAAPICNPPAADVSDFEDLAGLVQSLDLVVSVQTAAVHLAGALGVPTFAMAPTNPEWRYTGDGPRIPWYGSVRMFRQGASEGWGPVVRRVAEAVRERLA